MIRMAIQTLMFFLSLSVISVEHARATLPNQKKLPIGLTTKERLIAKPSHQMRTPPPVGDVRALSDEFEDAEAAMTLWDNPSLVSALAAHGNVRLLGDDASSITWWKNWLKNESIPSGKIAFFQIASDSIWIRDYGPWYILDGNHNFGIVDTTYNRPRPVDDLVPGEIASAIGVPSFQPGLVHTGGNYYPDEEKTAFSSTLVYSENPNLSADDVRARMKAYLGIENYFTGKLNPGITIEHMDTYGKLVSPDTWVYGEFPAGSKFRADSEAFLKKLQQVKSAYGTPYKIHRIKMTSINGQPEYYRAYINSFMSNDTLYFPTYGGQADKDAKAAYQAALPGYTIVGVDNGGTEWGDSVHCRTRNLLARDVVFLFPRVDDQGVIRAEAIPSPGAKFITGPKITWTASNGQGGTNEMTSTDGKTQFEFKLPALPSGTKVSFSVKAEDSVGKTKTVPRTAPKMTIDFTTP